MMKKMVFNKLWKSGFVFVVKKEKNQLILPYKH